MHKSTPSSGYTNRKYWLFTAFFCLKIGYFLISNSGHSDNILVSELKLHLSIDLKRPVPDMRRFIVWLIDAEPEIIKRVKSRDRDQEIRYLFYFFRAGLKRFFLKAHEFCKTEFHAL